MLSTPIAARGRTVYGSGTYAPNRGRVSASGTQGYIQRELKNRPTRVGGDGESDTRSGLAKRSLQNSQFFQGGKGPQGRRPHTAGQQQAQGAQTSPSPQGAPQAGGAPAPQLPQAVTINASGQLELPYSTDWSMELLDALSESNAALLGLQQEGQTQAAEYAKGKRDLTQQYDATKRGTLNNAAGRGTAFSSGYGLAVGNNARDFNNANNDMDMANAAFQNYLAAQKSQITTGFNQQLQRAVLDYADSVAEDAGSLGYGTDGSTPSGGGGGGKGKGPKGGGGKGPKGGGKDDKGPKSPGGGSGVRSPYQNDGRPLTRHPLVSQGPRKDLAKKAIAKGKR